MLISLHSQVKVIVYEMLYLLEMPKLTFKKVAARLWNFFCIFQELLLAQKQPLERHEVERYEESDFNATDDASRSKRDH